MIVIFIWRAGSMDICDKECEVNTYEGVKVAWDEYEYICFTIKNRILEIINNDFVVLTDEHGIKDEGYADVEIHGATINIIVKPGILISTLNKIESFLGVDGKILISGSKKNSRMKIIFENIPAKTIEDF